MISAWRMEGIGQNGVIACLCRRNDETNNHIRVSSAILSTVYIPGHHRHCCNHIGRICPPPPQGTGRQLSRVDCDSSRMCSACCLGLAVGVDYSWASACALLQTIQRLAMPCLLVRNAPQSNPMPRVRNPLGASNAQRLAVGYPTIATQ